MNSCLLSETKIYHLINKHGGPKQKASFAAESKSTMLSPTKDDISPC